MLKIVLISCLPFVGFAEELDVTKVSEAMGHMIGKNLESLGLDFNIDAIVKGMKEEAEGKNSPMNDDECVQAIAELQEEKMNTSSEQTLERADSISNGDQINENHPLPTTNSAKYR